MYIPAAMTMADEQQMFDLIARHPFGLLVSGSDTDYPEVSHLPFLLDREQRQLHCHLARANGHWQLLDNQAVRLVFNGPHAYISPLWYQQQPSVPTWNYSAVHVLGRARILPAEASVPLLERMCAHFEPQLLARPDVLAADNVARLSRAIVAISIEIERLEAKVKYGQHRKVADQQGVYQGLKQSGSADASALVEDMERLDLGLGKL